MKETEKIREALRGMADEKYRLFQIKLTPCVDPDTVLGVRVPQLRAYAKTLRRDDPQLAEAFLAELPHRYYDENMLHSLLLSAERKPCWEAVEAFLPHVDNWAVCDILSPAYFRKDPAGLYEHILVWLDSERAYTVRFGLEMLMSHFLDGRFRPEMLKTAAKVRHEDYYVRMMVAWYFATALAKQEEATLPLLEQRVLPVWVHNKAIQKAIESRRISDELKAYLRTLKKENKNDR